MGPLPVPGNSGRAHPRPLHFVTFHADLASGEERAHPHTEMMQRQYLEMIEMLFASARRAHPESRCTVLTTPDTNLGALSPWVDLFMCEAQAETLMFDRMAAQIRFLDQAVFDLPMVLVDTDILVVRPLAEVFEGDFDVGLTWRNVETMPFNGGVIFVNNVRPEAVRAFFRRVFEVYQRGEHEARYKWFGDQTAMAEFVDLAVEQIAETPGVERNGVKVSFLPCGTYNFSPENALAAIREPLRDKAILHFKGARKALMHCYFDAYLGFSARPSVRSLLARGHARHQLKTAPPMPEQQQEDVA